MDNNSSKATMRLGWQEHSTTQASHQNKWELLRARSQTCSIAQSEVSDLLFASPRTFSHSYSELLQLDLLQHLSTISLESMSYTQQMPAHSPV